MAKKYIADIWSPDWAKWQRQNRALMARGARLGTEYAMDGTPTHWVEIDGKREIRRAPYKIVEED